MVEERDAYISVIVHSIVIVLRLRARVRAPPSPHQTATLWWCWVIWVILGEFWELHNL